MTDRKGIDWKKVFYIGYYGLTFLVFSTLIALTGLMWQTQLIIALSLIQNPILTQLAITVIRIIPYWTAITILWFSVFQFLIYDKILTRG